MHIVMIDGLSTLYSRVPAQWHIFIQAAIKGNVTENCSMIDHKRKFGGCYVKSAQILLQGISSYIIYFCLIFKKCLMFLTV